MYGDRFRPNEVTGMVFVGFFGCVLMANIFCAVLNGFLPTI
jgi:hypothetical protein